MLRPVGPGGCGWLWPGGGGLGAGNLWRGVGQEAGQMRPGRVGAGDGRLTGELLALLGG